MTAPAVTGPSFLALQFEGVDRAAAFYEKTVGLVRAPHSPPGAVVFETSPISFAVRGALPGADLAAGRGGSVSHCGSRVMMLSLCTTTWLSKASRS